MHKGQEFTISAADIPKANMRITRSFIKAITGWLYVTKDECTQVYINEQVVNRDNICLETYL